MKPGDTGARACGAGERSPPTAQPPGQTVSDLCAPDGGLIDQCKAVEA